MKTLAKLAALALIALGTVAAGDGPAPKLTVAVLDFDAGVDAVKDLATTLPDQVEAELAVERGITLVSRRDLKKIQDEQSLNLAGLVAQGQGARVGKLVGARVLVLGRVMLVGEEVVITARAIGAETGVFLPTVVRGPAAKDAGPLVGKIAEKLRHLLVERGAELLPEPDPVDTAIEETAKAIAALDVEPPTVGVVVFEEHIGAPKQADPAAQTAIQEVLRRLGFRVKDVSGEETLSGLRAFYEGKGKLAARAVPDVDVLVLGEGFSEFGGRIGELVSAKARLEARAVRVADAEILEVYHGAGAAADLAERFAGKKALTELGRKAALKLALPVAKEGEPKKKD